MAATEREVISTAKQNRVPGKQLVAQQRNVGTVDRLISAVAGGALTTFGAMQRSMPGVALAVAGTYLIYRGVVGNCLGYQALGISTARPSQGIAVNKAVTINKTPAELYEFWHNFENLPRFMDHLQSVTVQDNNRSHWVAKAPAGTTVEWDAMITDERPNSSISWHSTPEASIANWGTVRFEEATGGRGTVVHVELEYQPPAGKLGAIVAKLFGEEPNQQISEDLRRFKRLMETGEIPTTEGQPRGSRSMLGKLLSPNS